MEFVVENLSPTRKKIAFTLTADDVNAAINTAVKGFQKDLSLPGFRKGKVPASVVEKRFGEDVYARATQDEINGLLQKTLKDSSLTPVSSMEMDNHDAFARDTEFKCNVTFDVLPEIEFPNYEGLEVDQAKADVSDEDVNEIIENLRGRMAELTEVTEDRLPQDGDTVDVDYSGTDEEGNKIDDVQGENFGVALGQGQALPDFEALVKTAKVGEEKTGPVNFPADYPHKPLAGKTVIFTIKVNKIQTSQKPEVNEEFAQKVGQESLEKMKTSIVEHVSATKAQAARSEAMKKLIDGLQSAIVRTGSQDTAISVKAVLLRVHIEKLKKVVFAQIFRQLPMHDKTDNAHQTRVGDVGRDKLLPAGGCAFGKTAAQNLKGRRVLIHSVTLEPFLAVYIQYN